VGVFRPRDKGRGLPEPSLRGCRSGFLDILCFIAIVLNELKLFELAGIQILPIFLYSIRLVWVDLLSSKFRWKKLVEIIIQFLADSGLQKLLQFEEFSSISDFITSIPSNSNGRLPLGFISS